MTRLNPSSPKFPSDCVNFQAQRNRLVAREIWGVLPMWAHAQVDRLPGPQPPQSGAEPKKVREPVATRYFGAAGPI